MKTAIRGMGNMPLTGGVEGPASLGLPQYLNVLQRNREKEREAERKGIIKEAIERQGNGRDNRDSE